MVCSGARGSQDYWRTKNTIMDADTEAAELVHQVRILHRQPPPYPPDPCTNLGQVDFGLQNNISRPALTDLDGSSPPVSDQRLPAGSKQPSRYEDAVSDYNDLWEEKKDLQDRIDYQSFYTALYSEDSALDRLREVSSVMESMRKTWKSAGKNIEGDARNEWQSTRGDWMRDTRTKEERDLFHSMARHLAYEDTAGRA